jgi:hypothetical protein
MFKDYIFEYIVSLNKIANYITGSESVAKAALYKAKSTIVKYIFLDVVNSPRTGA